MKRYESKLLMILALIFINLSCEKADSKFVIGKKTKSVNIVTPDTPIVINNINYELDVNMDGYNDLNFYSSFIKTYGGIRRKRSYMPFLMYSNFQVSVIELFDTKKKCIEYKNDTVKSYTYYNDRFGFHCCDTCVDSISSIFTYLCPVIYSEGDILTNSEKWSIDSKLILSDKDTSTYNWVPIRVNARLLYGQWDNQEMRFLLIRQDTGTKTLYGWIKLTISDSYKITIYEYALQKD